MHFKGYTGSWQNLGLRHHNSLVFTLHIRRQLRSMHRVAGGRGQYAPALTPSLQTSPKAEAILSCASTSCLPRQGQSVLRQGPRSQQEMERKTAKHPHSSAAPHPGSGSQTTQRTWPWWGGTTKTHVAAKAKSFLPPLQRALEAVPQTSDWFSHPMDLIQLQGQQLRYATIHYKHELFDNLASP